MCADGKETQRVLAEPKDSVHQYFIDWVGHVFGFGYGIAEEPILRAVKRFFELVATEEDSGGCRRYDYEVLEEELGKSLAWVLICLFIREEIIEYGFSPTYGWLSKTGLALQEYMSDRSAEDLIRTVDGGEIDCGPSYCNCWPPPGVRGKPIVVCNNPFWVKSV